MAFTFGFYNSLDGDRKYTAEQISEIFDGIIGDGVFDSIGELFAVRTANDGMNIIVGTGRAWFDHTWNKNDSDMVLTVEQSDPILSRYDAVVLEVDSSAANRTNSIKIVKGTFAATPAKPALINEGSVHQHPLAYVLVGPDVSEITAADIENAVGTAACPFVTGVVETTDIDVLFRQWEGEFDDWFENVKEQLSDNVVTNLQLQIERCVQKSDKATDADIKAGTAGKWVDAAGLRNSSAMAKKVMVEFLTSGTWTAPANIVDNKIHVWCVGGGGGGGSGQTYGQSPGGGGGGGGSGYIEESDFVVLPGSSHSIVIGAGGSGGTPRYSNSGGTIGGTTAFGDLLSASGGNGGSNGKLTNGNQYGGSGGDGESGGGAGSGTTNYNYWHEGYGRNGGNGGNVSYSAATDAQDSYPGTDHVGVGGKISDNGTERSGGGGGGYGSRGGSGITNKGSVYTGGGGGGGFFGDGGDGSWETGVAGENGIRGGGGGGGSGSGSGGSGGSGVVRIEYYIKGAAS